MIRGTALILALLFLAPLSASAQSEIAGGVILITTIPARPGPGQEVRLEAQSPSLDLTALDLTWRANGEIVMRGTGAVSAAITLGPTGTETTIELTASDGETVLTDSIRIIPATVDLLWEADSYVPNFFAGRALASAGTKVRLLAIAHLPQSGGREIDAKDITFTWRKNGQVIGGSGRGKSSITTSAPNYLGADLITVDAVSADKSVSATASVRISALEPELVLYESHPLFGTLYHRAIGATHYVPEIETTFALIPYFAQASAATDPALRFEWLVNKRRIPANAAQPNTITINAESSTGIALLEATVTHARNLFMETAAAWNLTFTRAAGLPTESNDPFRGN